MCADEVEIVSRKDAIQNIGIFDFQWVPITSEMLCYRMQGWMADAVEQWGEDSLHFRMIAREPSCLVGVSDSAGPLNDESQTVEFV
ncbi:hypothetical protein llg_01610 [Luteolibacter sp. LG18]|nr:hypothetical protein llg_01610 [Luteolibacter sp. LG18]